MTTTTRSLEKPLAASALALDGTALALLGAGTGTSRVVLALLAHGAAAVCAVAFLRRRADRLGLDRDQRGATLLLFMVAAMLPLVGPAALARLFVRMARPPVLPEALLVRAPVGRPGGARPLRGEHLGAPVPVPIAAAAATGQASLEARLRFHPLPADRVAAVLATRRLATPADATRLLKLALRDAHEDVRLLAHALLEDRDRQAYAGLERIERALAAAPTERRAGLACLLGESLLELCASGLASGELETFTLRRARTLLEEARASGTLRAPASAALMLGRVLARQGDLVAARAAFDESRRLGAPAVLWAPELAMAGSPDRYQASSKAGPQ
jgi:hypothetical protein